MYIGFSKRLKKMSGLRFGVGLRLTKRNWWFIWFALIFVLMFYMIYYTFIGIAWMFYGLYKLYYWLFKGIVLGCKKLIQLIREKKAAKETPQGTPSAPFATADRENIVEQSESHEIDAEGSQPKTQKEKQPLKKSALILFIVAALFLLCSFTFLPNQIAEFISGIVIAAVLAFVGYWQQRKPAVVKEETVPETVKPAADPQSVINKAETACATPEVQKSEPTPAQTETQETNSGVTTFEVSGVTFGNRQRVLAGLYRESDGIGIAGRLEKCEYEGEPAICVYGEDKLIGFIRKSDLPQALEILDHIEDMGITIDYFEEDKKIYYAEVRVIYTV